MQISGANIFDIDVNSFRVVAGKYTDYADVWALLTSDAAFKLDKLDKLDKPECIGEHGEMCRLKWIRTKIAPGSRPLAVDKLSCALRSAHCVVRSWEGVRAAYDDVYHAQAACEMHVNCSGVVRRKQ